MTTSAPACLDCRAGDGEHHWLHVPTEEAMRIAPAQYLSELPLLSPAAVLGLTTRLEERPELFKRVCFYVACGERPTQPGWRDSDWRALLDWLLERSGGGGVLALRALVRLELDDPSFTARFATHPSCNAGLLLARARHVGQAHRGAIAASGPLGRCGVGLLERFPDERGRRSALEALEAAGPEACEVAAGLCRDWDGTLDKLVEAARTLAGESRFAAPGDGRHTARAEAASVGVSGYASAGGVVPDGGREQAAKSAVSTTSGLV